MTSVHVSVTDGSCGVLLVLLMLQVRPLFEATLDEVLREPDDCSSSTSSSSSGGIDVERLAYIIHREIVRHKR
jgi:hypothetical protein